MFFLHLLLRKWFLPCRRAQNEIGIALVHNFEYVELSQMAAATDISAFAVDFCRLLRHLRFLRHLVSLRLQYMLYLPFNDLRR